MVVCTTCTICDRGAAGSGYLLTPTVESPGPGRRVTCDVRHWAAEPVTVQRALGPG
jgi:hypothetical protein